VNNAGYVYLNGAVLPAEKARISPFDRGLLLGDGLFETLRVYDGVPFLWPEHFRRLAEGCRRTGMRMPLPSRRWQAVIRNLVRRNRLAGGSLRITITRGEYRGSLAYETSLRPTVFVFTRPFTGYDPAWYARGAGLITSSVRKAGEPDGQPAIKSTNYLPHIKARREADRLRCQEAVILTTRGYLAECSTSNLFFIRGNTLNTPSLDLEILAGITRGLVLKLARRRGLMVAEGHFTPAQLAGAREAFLTSSLREIMPAVRYDGTRLGDGRVGPVTRALAADYSAYVRRYCHRAGAKLL
jgi:branched-subunit amino acid aminotransferase/4-amino-4-deoxychorismate lyase